MKVLYLVGSPIKLSSVMKGSGTWVLTLIDAVKKYSEGIEVAVGYTDPLIKIISKNTEDGIIYAGIPTFRGNKLKIFLFNRGLYDPYENLISDTQKLIDDIKPDLIHLFGFEGPFIRIAGMVSKPVVIDFQGFKPAYRFKTDHNRLIRNTCFSKIFSPLKKLTKDRTAKIKGYEDKLEYQQVDYMLGRTFWDYFVAKAVNPGLKYFYCQRIVRPEFFKNDWKAQFTSHLRLFTTTKDAFYKNIDMIYETLNLLNIYNPSLKITWKIAGVDNSSKIPSFMQKKFPALKTITLLGKLTAKEISTEMMNSDIYVLPSAVENSPNALLEAMTIGMPVIATHSGGTSFFIEHGKDGYLVPEGEPYALAGAITDLSQNYAKAINLGETARMNARIRHDPSTVFQQLHEAYIQIIEDFNQNSNKNRTK